MTDVYQWFDPFQAKDDAAYWEERSYYERRDLEREVDMMRGAVKATEAHIRYMTDQMAKAFSAQIATTPIFDPAGSLAGEKLNF